MKRTRHTMMAAMLAAIFILFGLIIAVLNIATAATLKQQAHEALRNERDLYASLGSAALSSDAAEGESPSVVLGGNMQTGAFNMYEGGVSYFIVGSDYRALDDSSGLSPVMPPTQEEALIADFCATRSDEVDSDTVEAFSTECGDYLIMQVSLSSRAANGSAAARDAAFAVLVLYVNTKPAASFVAQLNAIFFVVLLVAGAGTAFAGMRLGRRIEDSQARMERFFQNASHELKTPLMSIQGYAEGISANVVDPRIAAAVIMEESDRMANLVGEMLSLSKIDSEHFALRRDPFDLRELLYDCMSSLEGQAQRRNLTLDPCFPNQPVIVAGDEEQLRRVFLNLLANAVRYAASTIQVECVVQGRRAVVVVRDDGAGVPEEDLAHLFERFHAGPKGETGLGLALAKEVVELHKGTISAENGEIGKPGETSGTRGVRGTCGTRGTGETGGTCGTGETGGTCGTGFVLTVVLPLAR